MGYGVFMHSVESSIIMAIVLLFIMCFITTVINTEQKIGYYVDDKYTNEMKNYSEESENNFNPQNWQRAITVIENIIKEEE